MSGVLREPMEGGPEMLPGGSGAWSMSGGMISDYSGKGGKKEARGRKEFYTEEKTWASEWYVQTIKNYTASWKVMCCEASNDDSWGN